MNKTRKKPLIFLMFGCLIALTIWLYWGNNSIEMTHLNIKDRRIPESFHEFTIVQISDLHNTEFGAHQNTLLKKVSKAKPDFIAITGDLIDSNHTDIAKAMDFVEKAVAIAPIYFVSGNHEAWSEKYADLEDKLRQAGVTILDDRMVTIQQGNAAMEIIGLSDPDFALKNDMYDETNVMVNKKLQEIVNKDFQYKILLSHRPELVEVYAENSINLVLSGHAHGGQFRIPFLGGVIAPEQGIFPKYTEEKYQVKQTQMIVSRGLGNSIIPIRINNRPEIVVITLK